jgi:allantoicase
MSELETEVICELLRALANHENDETPAEAFYEAWDTNRERAGPFDEVVRELHGRELIRARTKVDRHREVGNEQPLISTELIVEGITGAGVTVIEEQCP